MKNIISKELLSEVLNKEVFNVFPAADGDRGQSIRENHIAIVVNNGRKMYFNIYELAYKNCKEWALSKGYDFDPYGYAVDIFNCKDGRKFVKGFIPTKELDTECKRIFKACEWIRKELLNG